MHTLFFLEQSTASSLTETANLLLHSYGIAPGHPCIHFFYLSWTSYSQFDADYSLVVVCDWFFFFKVLYRDQSHDIMIKKLFKMIIPLTHLGMLLVVLVIRTSCFW